MSATTARLQVRPMEAPLAADIIGFPFHGWTPDDIAQVRTAWQQHLVLRFRDTELDDPTQIRFSAAFGPPVIHPRQLQQGAHGNHPEILTISNMKKTDGTPAGDLGDGEVLWHTDTWFKQRPPAGSFLRALIVPPKGGNTHFLNMAQAYETLPASLKRAIANRTIHHQTVYDGRGELRLGMTLPTNPDPRTWPGVDHPILRRHAESNRLCLFLGGRRHATIPGLPPAESDALLDALWTHAETSNLTWTQVWRPNDMVAWDNRAVMHRRDSFDPNATRLMHRTTAEGEIPTGPGVPLA